MSAMDAEFGSLQIAHRDEDSSGSGGRKRTADVLTDEVADRKFGDLHLPGPVLGGLNKAGFERPSPIQWSALPLAKVGLDLVVQSKSGTGKTLIYAVTALCMVDPSVGNVQALVLTPTREIAVQGATLILDIAGSGMKDVRACVLIGGMSVQDDIAKLQRCQIAIGTPGRVRQLVEEGFLRTDLVRLFVLDEADKMLEPSFVNDVFYIFNKSPTSKQVLALSATYPEALATQLAKLMRNPEHVRPDAKSQTLLGISHYCLMVSRHPQLRMQFDIKYRALLGLLSSVTFSQCLIFINHSITAENLCERLTISGWPSVFMAASLQSQMERLKAINSLKSFATRIVVTTDLTARGIDAANVTLVVNFDVPWSSRTFLHRSGRAGRFGTRGLNLTLAAQGAEFDLLRNTVFRTGVKIRLLQSDSKGGDESKVPDLWKLKDEDPGLLGELVDGLECRMENDSDEEWSKERPPAEKGQRSEEAEHGSTIPSTPKKSGSKIKRRGKRKPKAEAPQVPVPAGNDAIEQEDPDTDQEDLPGQPDEDRVKEDEENLRYEEVHGLVKAKAYDKYTYENTGIMPWTEVAKPSALFQTDAYSSGEDQWQEDEDQLEPCSLQTEAVEGGQEDEDFVIKSFYNALGGNRYQKSPAKSPKNTNDDLDTAKGNLSSFLDQKLKIVKYSNFTSVPTYADSLKLTEEYFDEGVSPRLSLETGEVDCSPEWVESLEQDQSRLLNHNIKAYDGLRSSLKKRFAASGVPLKEMVKEISEGNMELLVDLATSPLIEEEAPVGDIEETGSELEGLDGSDESHEAFGYVVYQKGDAVEDEDEDFCNTGEMDDVEYDEPEEPVSMQPLDVQELFPDPNQDLADFLKPDEPPTRSNLLTEFCHWFQRVQLNKELIFKTEFSRLSSQIDRKAGGQDKTSTRNIRQQ